MDIQPTDEATAPLVPPSEEGDVDDVPCSSLTKASNDAIDPFPNPSLNDPSALEVAQVWAEYTSIHGMYYILERGHFKMRWKAAWWTFVLTMFAGLTWALVSEFRDFAKYSVDASTRAVVPRSLEFPTVTLCNANGGRDANRMEETGIAEPRNEGELMAVSQPLEEFVL